jgi:predicted transcriptional regulator
VQGFTKRGDLVVDDGWVIDRDFGHLTHGYVLTSHASQGDTVDKVFVAISSQSLPATNQRTAYVALTRGKEQAVVFTDDRKELLKTMSRPDDPMSATELAEPMQEKPALRDRLMKRLAIARRLGIFGQRRDSLQQDRIADRGLDHAG